MKMVESGYGDEVIKDATAGDDLAKAKRRQALCVQNSTEQDLYAYAPNEATGNKNPGYPDANYGAIKDD